MDAFDVFAFVVFGVLIGAIVIIAVTLGQLPGQIADRRSHPQAAAINVASWLGIATLGLLWPLALIWAFMNPNRASNQAVAPSAGETVARWSAMQARVESLESEVRRLDGRKDNAT